jgi:4'-phosphopantetheinyl transferase
MILPKLQSDTLQLWQLDLADTAGLEPIAERFLTKAEMDRAVRLRAGRVRDQFITTRACLRHLLGSVLGIRPIDVEIENTSYGKPELSIPEVFFNVTHSGNTALIAISLLGPIGVDIERINAETDVMELAAHSFSPSEYGTLKSLAPDERQQAFFQCWTQKEAVMKADGRGLSIPLSSFEVPVIQATATAVRLEQGQTYFVTNFEIGEGYAGAYAMETIPECVQMLRIPIRALLGME